MLFRNTLLTAPPGLSVSTTMPSLEEPYNDTESETDKLPKALLKEHLLNNYDRDIRPIMDFTKPVEVTVDMALHSIISVVRQQ